MLLAASGCDFQKELRRPYPVSTSLAALAGEHHFHIGTAVQTFLIDGPRQDPAYVKVLVREFNSVTPENAMKFDAIHPEPQRYDFAQADRVVELAQKNGMQVHGHTLAWDRQLPPWIVDGHFTPVQLGEILKDHIHSVMAHYRQMFPGVVQSWDVVNESFETESPWNHIAPTPAESTKWAFLWAREADPSAKLYYNDSIFDPIEGNEEQKERAFLWIERLKKEGTPIDGIGIQMHLTSAARIDLERLRATIQRFSNLGLEVQITELDRGLKLPPTAEDLKSQAQLYGKVVAVCLGNPACKGVTFWGFVDGYSWIPSVYRGYGSALLFDEQYRPKPAYWAVVDAFSNTRR